MPKLQLDALIRVSRRGGREGESFRSPQQQRDICQQWADAHDAEIVQWHESIDVSGKTMARQDIEDILARLRASQTEGLITAFVSRLSRARVEDAFEVWNAIKEAKGRLVVCELAGIDLDSAVGEMTFTSQLGLARYQWRQFAERWEMTREEVIKAGKSISNRAAFGYRFKDPTRIGNRLGDTRLVPDETTATILLELFERKAGGATWLELARWLDEVAPKPDGRKWGRTSVQSIIRNRVYLGELRHGKYVNANAHEPLVSIVLWRKAQNPPGRRTPRGTYLLTGLARCAGCGRTLRGSTLGRGQAHVYLCQGKDCHLRSSIIQKRLDDEVTIQFFSYLDAFHLMAVDDGAIQQAEIKVKKLTEKVQLQAQIAPNHPTALKAHQEALEAAEAELVKAEDDLARVIRSYKQSGPSARELKADWPDLALDERREILRAGIDAILVRRAIGKGPASDIPKRLLVLFHGEAPKELLGVNPARSWAWDDDPVSLRLAA